MIIYLKVYNLFQLFLALLYLFENLALLYLLEISPLVPFLKDKYMPGSGIGSSSICDILNIASQLKAGALK